jgi:RHS repeat-associated protein
MNKRSGFFAVIIVFVVLLAGISVFGAPKWCPDLAGEDNFVDFRDFAVLAENWQKEGVDAGDFDDSNIVDINDLAYFSDYWLSDVNCPEYYMNGLPYMTSFEQYQGFTATTNPNNPVPLDYQKGWQVNAGFADIQIWWAWSDELNDYTMYQYVVTDANTTIMKEFNDEGSYHDYIRFSFIPSIDQKINIKNDSNTIASVWFKSDGYIYVLDDSNYVNTNEFYGSVYNDCWYYYSNSYDYENTFTDLKLKINWSSENYEVYFDGGTTDIADQAEFEQESNLTTLHIENTEDWYVLNSFSISNWSSDAPGMEITSPCACDSDADLKGKVPVIGTTKGANFGKYDLYCCPVDLDTSNFDNWIKFDEGCNITNNGILGYWDTARIPNGYYHIGYVLFNDLGYPEGLPSSWLNIITKELYIGGNKVYDNLGYFAVVGDLKCNTFAYTEQPDISVNWEGEFPFEFKRIYNNNRRFYEKPLCNGWTHNSQITLTEDTTYDWEMEDVGYYDMPSWDEYGLGFGYIWVSYPDGSKQLFRHTTGHDYSNPVVYKPYPDDNSGDRVKRYSEDDGWGTVTEIDYYLEKRDGTTMYFTVNGPSLPGYYGYYGEGSGYGTVGWSVKSGIQSKSDKFGNSLSYDWNYEKTAVESITDGHSTIEFDMQDDYYTQATLEVDSQVYRTVEFDYTEPNSSTGIYTVTKTGKGVNENGVYDANNDKEYEINYVYDAGDNLRKVIYGSDINKPNIEVEYDNYGRVDIRRDYIEQGNYLETSYDYQLTTTELTTTVSTPPKDTIVTQNNDGAVTSREIITSDGSAVTNQDSLYEDSGNLLKPTDIFEYFDGKTRHTENEYNSYGDVTLQKVYIDDSNYIATEMDYHPEYSLPVRQTSWQDVNESGQKVEKLSIYGDAGGGEDEYGEHLVKEKTLLAEDPNVWAVTSYTYRDDGQVKTKTDPNGFITFYEYDENGYIELISKGDNDSNQPVSRFYHNEIGERLLAANNLGGVVMNDYDDFGRLWRASKYTDPNAMFISDAEFIPSRYEAMTAVSTVIYGYDDNGNRTYEKQQAGGQVYTDYTRNNLVDMKTFDDGSYIEYDYDARGNKIQQYRYEDGSGQDWYTLFEYDSMDRLTETEWLDYDDSTVIKRIVNDYYGTGKKRTQQFCGWGGAVQKETEYDYDILGRLTDVIVAPDSLTLTTGYEYDAAGNRVGATDPNGNTVYTLYDNANRRILQSFALPAGEDPNQVKVSKEYYYYENNQLRDVNSYDYDGDLLSHSGYEYDSRGRVTKVIQDINDTTQAITTYDYNDTGIIYDSNEYNIKVTDAEGKQTFIKLDEFSNRTRILHPSGNYEQMEYNPDGTLATKAVWDSNDTKHWINYYYDGYGRLADVNYPDGGNVHYSYDGFGRKILVEDNRVSEYNIGGSGQIAYEYDPLERVVSITDHDDYETTYEYQADGQKSGIKVYQPDDTLIYDVYYTYDSAGRLRYVREPLSGSGPVDGYIAEFDYDDNGNRSGLTYYRTGSLMGSTVRMDYSYDADNHLTGFTTTGGPTFEFADANIDGLGRLLDANETITTVGGNTIDHSYTYDYDMLGRLSYAYIDNVPPTPAREWAYWYDKSGNVVKRMSNNYDPDDEHYKNYVYDGELLTSSALEVINWDLNGWQRSKLDYNPGFYIRDYDWDGKTVYGQYLNSSLAMKAVYSPEGWRTEKERLWNLTSYEHKYIVDPTGDYPQTLLVIDINDANNPVAKTFIHANNQILCQHYGDYTADRYFYLSDRNNNVRELINDSGSVENCYYYTPWGGTTGSETEENISNWYGFGGYWVDEEVGQYYCNARQYDVGTRRFTTRDPVRGTFKEPMTLHPYLYCLNDPVNKIDPNGKFFGYVTMVAGLSIGEAFRHSENYTKFAAYGYAVGAIGGFYDIYMSSKAMKNFKDSEIYKTFEEWRGGWKGKDADEILDDLGY